jgi:hypothetical protein
MKTFLCQVSDELLAAIEAARGDSPRNPWLESVLWKSKPIRDGARTAGVEKPARAADGRGGARPRRPPG